jgi:hypothetical protein
LALGHQQHRVKPAGTGAAHELGVGGVNLRQYFNREAG